MAKRFGPVHVATTRRRYNGVVYETHLLRRSYREGKKVKHQTLGNISHLPLDLIDIIRQYLRGEIPPVAFGGFHIIRSLPHGHIAAALGALKSISLDNIIASRHSRQRDLVLAMIVARVIEPHSKLATFRALQPETATSTLAMEFGITIDDERELYDAMDWLVERQQHIEKKLAEKHLHDGSLVLYDVSSSFYTGKHCTLAKFGHNRDGKNGYPQIVYGLLCNSEGCPVAIEVFEGNTADPATLSSQIEKIRTRFHIIRIILVGDRGMITSKRIDETLRGVEGLDWITALRADSIKKLAEKGIIQTFLFDETDLVEVQSPDFPDERLVVCRNPFLTEERRRKRNELLAATEKSLDAVVLATNQQTRPLKGKDKIGLRVGRIVNRYKVAKHFILEITDNSFSYSRDKEKIAAEANLDGLYVIRTSVDQQALSAQSAVRAYKDLSKVERAFRSMKTVDLKIRPIFHRLEDRVRAHVFLCMLAYYVEWHMRLSLQDILFDDDDKASAEALRSSIVAPALRSERAKKKDKTKHTEEGLPVHSFRTLLEDLSTLSKNLVRTTGPNPCEFWVLTQPTDLQRHVFELLGVKS